MERVAEETDILIIGGGPAGMSAAIRARQIAEEKGAVSKNHIGFDLFFCGENQLIDSLVQRVKQTTRAEVKMGGRCGNSSGGMHCQISTKDTMATLLLTLLVSSRHTH